MIKIIASRQSTGTPRSARDCFICVSCERIEEEGGDDVGLCMKPFKMQSKLSVELHV